MGMTKIEKKISGLALLETCVVLCSTFSSTPAGSIVWAGEDNKVTNESSPAFIIKSNGQIISRALLLDPSLLLATRQAFQNDNNNDAIVQTSIEQLLLQANSFLSLRPTSVFEKSEIPPSGDKHDFLSLAPYGWPDPTKQNGLPYVNYDGKVNPEIYSIPDSKNMDEMIYRVKILSLAFYFTGNPEYASKAEVLIRVWFLNNSTYMHPNFQYAAMERGENNGTMAGILYGKNLPDVIDAIRLIRHSPSWSKQDQNGMELWFTKYLDRILYSEHGREERRQPNNHGTWYRVQVSAIALFLNKIHLAKSILRDAGNKLVTRQIEPNGSQRYEITRKDSLEYSIFNLLGLFKLASIAQHLGIDLWNYKTREGAGLQKALDYLLPTLLNKETWPHSQIKPNDRKNMVDLICRAAIHYTDNQSYIQACASANVENIRLKQTR